MAELLRLEYPGRETANGLDLKTPKLSSHLTIESWIKDAINIYNMYPQRVSDIQQLLSHSSEDEISDEHYPEPELVTSISTQLRFKGKEVRIILRLHSSFLLARTLSPEDEAIFTILDESRTGHIISEFPWDLKFYWSKFGFRREEGFWPMSPQFSCSVNSKGTKVIIVGPPEFPGDTIPTTKILDCVSWKTRVINISGIKHAIPLWPVNVEFDPREKDTDIVTMVCTERHRHRYSPSVCVTASLIQLDVNQDHIVTLKEDYVQSGFLKYLKEGCQFICLLSAEEDRNRKLGIFNSDTAIIVFIIDLQDVELSTRWESACTHLIPIYSACYKFLSLVLWKKNVPEECIISDVVTFSLPYLGDMLPTLKQVCRAVIICNLSEGAIQKLPLPGSLLNFVKGLLQ